MSRSNGQGHHWSKFVWRDWASDDALRTCSMAAQGFWMRLLCIAHGADPVGHVLLNGRKPTPKQLASITGATEREVTVWTAELDAAGVFSRTDDGVIYSRRMVRDAAASEAGRHWGKTGGNPNLKRHPLNPDPNGGIREGVNPPDNPGGSKHANPQSLEPESEKEPPRFAAPPLGGGAGARASGRSPRGRVHGFDALARERAGPLEINGEAMEILNNSPENVLPLRRLGGADGR